MDEYRQTLLGRALADVLQDMETRSALAPEHSDLLFELFDEVMREELSARDPAAAPRATRPAKKPKQDSSTRAVAQSTSQAEPPAAQPAQALPPPPLVFTHQQLEITGRVLSFNRFMDKWSIHAAVDPRGLVLDGEPVELLAATTTDSPEILIKLHDPQQLKPGRR